MRLPPSFRQHLTYCANIHPGESWQEVWQQWKSHLPEIKKKISPDNPLGVGARFSAKAITELLEADNLLSLHQWMLDEDLYVFTINGFPYGRFHQGRIKENVYLPDWSTTARLEYTKQLAKVLSELLPADCDGSISTVPVGIKSNFQDPEKLSLAIHHLQLLAEYLDLLHSETGKYIKLALEPEPGCYLESTSDIVGFFENQLPINMSKEVSNHLSVCIDTCHATVINEKPDQMLTTLAQRNIPIGKIQLTSALHLKEISEEQLEKLSPLCESAYFHQTSIISPEGEHTFFMDLPNALQCLQPDDEMYVHCHVPVYCQTMDELRTTQDDLTKVLHLLADKPVCNHLEIETYTFNFLAERYQQLPVVDHIAMEIKWVLETLSECNQERH